MLPGPSSRPLFRFPPTITTLAKLRRHHHLLLVGAATTPRRWELLQQNYLSPLLAISCARFLEAGPGDLLILRAYRIFKTTRRVFIFSPHHDSTCTESRRIACHFYFYDRPILLSYCIVHTLYSIAKCDHRRQDVLFWDSSQHHRPLGQDMAVRELGA